MLDTPQRAYLRSNISFCRAQPGRRSVSRSRTTESKQVEQHVRFVDFGRRRRLLSCVQLSICSLVLYRCRSVFVAGNKASLAATCTLTAADFGIAQAIGVYSR